MKASTAILGLVALTAVLGGGGYLAAHEMGRQLYVENQGEVLPDVTWIDVKKGDDTDEEPEEEQEGEAEAAEDGTPVARSTSTKPRKRRSARASASLALPNAPFQPADPRTTLIVHGEGKAPPTGYADRKQTAAKSTAPYERLGTYHYEVDPNWLKAQANRESPRWWANVTPHMTPQGDMDGWLLNAMAADALPVRLGLRNGDVVHRVNGRSIASLDDAAALGRSLDGARRVKVSISRGRTPITLVYDAR